MWKRTSAIVLIVLALSSGIAGAADNTRSTIQLQDDRHLVIEAATRPRVLIKFDLRPGEVSSPVDTEPALRELLRHATGLATVGGRSFIQDGNEYIVVVARSASNPRGGSGYCGAGDEDALLLLELEPLRPQPLSPLTLRLRDQMSIQSCLRSVELVDDQGGDFPARFERLPDPSHVELHGSYPERSQLVTVDHRRFARKDIPNR